jgi:hypothetical protein
MLGKQARQGQGRWHLPVGTFGFRADGRRGAVGTKGLREGGERI